jgi:putative tricarboxylic transport membrane protein
VKIDDTIWGGLLAAFGAAVLFYVQRFPNIPGQSVGPGMFPGLVGTGLLACGLILAVRGWRRRQAVAGAWTEVPAWLRSPPQLRAFAVLVAVNGFYLLAVDRLGFLIVAVVYLFLLMWALKVRPLRAAVAAVLMTLAIHYAFYKLLKVPLPWGVLQGVAW